MTAPADEPHHVVELMSEVLERAQDALAVDLMLASAVRTAGLSLDVRRRAGSAVHRRAVQLLRSEPLGDSGAPAVALAAVVHTWPTGKVQVLDLDDDVAPDGHWHYSQPPAPLTRLIWLTQHRARECAELIGAGQSRQLLSEPTHESGGIDAGTLLARVTAASDRGLCEFTPLAAVARALGGRRTCRALSDEADGPRDLFGSVDAPADRPDQCCGGGASRVCGASTGLRPVRRPRFPGLQADRAPTASRYTPASRRPSTPSMSLRSSSKNAPTAHAPRPMAVAVR